jgi:hypothetical protein
LQRLRCEHRVARFMQPQRRGASRTGSLNILDVAPHPDFVADGTFGIVSGPSSLSHGLSGCPVLGLKSFQ